MVGLTLPGIRETQSRVRHLAALIAKYSYGIYLTHVVALWLGSVVWDSVTLTVLLVVALPVVAYHAVEAPLITIGGRVAGWAVPRTTQSTAANVEGTVAA
jgi:peptidoglycan/LPS O-acetylase OafA/YrhL